MNSADADMISERIKEIQARLKAYDDLRETLGANLKEIDGMDDLEPQHREAVDDLKEMMATSDAVNSFCKEAISVRMESGAPGSPFLDAILMWLADLLDMSELDFEALKFMFDACKHLFHAIKYTAMAAVEGVKCMIHEANSRKAAADSTQLHAEAASLSAASGGAAAAASAAAGDPITAPIAPGLEALSGFLQTQALEAAFQGGLASDEAAKWAAHAKENNDHANEHISDAGTEFVECGKCILSCAKHILFNMLKSAHAGQVMAFQAAVLAVEPVPELPLPISGWDIEDPYDWVPGDLQPVIRQIVPEIVKNLTSLTPIIQSANVTPMIDGIIPNEAYEIPKMEFLDGGTVFD